MFFFYFNSHVATALDARDNVDSDDFQIFFVFTISLAFAVLFLQSVLCSLLVNFLFGFAFYRLV